MKSIAITLILLGAFVLVKSLFFEPSPNDARKVVEKYIEAVSQGNMRLAAFQLTEMKELPGREGQSMEMGFEASVECVGDDPAPGASAVTFAFDRVNLRDIRPLSPGEHRYVRGVIHFEKTTFGWLGKPM